MKSRPDEQGDVEYIYIVVRQDLSFEQQAVQACHAAINAARSFLDHRDQHPHLVLLGVPDHDALHQLRRRLLEVPVQREIEYSIFWDSDLPEPNTTALATEPISGEDRKFFKGYPLLTFARDPPKNKSFDLPTCGCWRCQGLSEPPEDEFFVDEDELDMMGQ